MKISNKQLEVLKLMNKDNNCIILLKGISPHCFVSHNLTYRISLATLFALKDKRLIYISNDSHRDSEFSLTDKAKEYFKTKK